MNSKGKSDKLETLRVKAALFSYFHFYKGFDIVCNEFCYGSSDVLAIQANAIFEVEVKVSVGDLRREKDKYKHKYCEQKLLEEGRTPWRFFYFAVPYGIKNEAYAFVKEQFPLSGLLVLNDGDFSSYGATGIDTKIKAQKLTPYYFGCKNYEHLKTKALHGMATSLSKTYYDLYFAKKALLPLRLI